MISYDDLVVALASWRARQGLPVVQAPGAPPATVPAARSVPPTPTRTGGRVAEHDFDDSALVEAYEAGDDDVVGVEHVGEPTAIGLAPEPVTEGVLMPRRGKRDW